MAMKPGRCDHPHDGLEPLDGNAEKSTRSALSALAGWRFRRSLPKERDQGDDHEWDRQHGDDLVATEDRGSDIEREVERGGKFCGGVVSPKARQRSGAAGQDLRRRRW